MSLAQSLSGSGLIETGPDAFSETTSLRSIIAASPDAPVHILFVHGIRADDRGASDAFRAGLWPRLKPFLSKPEPAKTVLNHRLNIGPRADLTYLGEPIWATDEIWKAGGPFVDRYEFARGDGAAPVVVDEINWWPLAIPLRCRALLEQEADLAGPDVDKLRVCAALDKDGAPLDDGIHYPFLSKSEFERLSHTKPKGGRAACVNGDVKRALMDWGLSDAVIALGPMQHHLRETIDKALEYALARHKEPEMPATFVVVAESLGSFIVFDAYVHEKPSAHAVMDRTGYIYFFANQLTLLELGRLSSAGAPSASVSMHKALGRWAGAAERPHGGVKQIIAFSDPSDALTFRVPKIDGVRVVNVCDRNGLDVLRIAADPVAAHTGHSRNPHVLDVILGKAP